MTEQLTSFTFNHSAQLDSPVAAFGSSAAFRTALDSRGEQLRNKVNEIISDANLGNTPYINVKNSPYFASGLATTAIGSITTGTKALTLTTTPDFVQGQGINLEGAKEASSLQVTAAATVSSNVTVNLNGVAFLVAVASGDTIAQVATKIRAATYAGWTAGGTALSDTVTFTSTTSGTKTDATYSAGTTTAAGTMTTVTQGTADQISTVSSVSGLVVSIADNATRTIAAGTILHDDTTAIQTVLDSIKTTGGVVVFPSGSYRIDSPLVVWNKTLISGAGRNNTVIFKTSDTTYTGTCGVAKNCVVYMDYVTGGYNFYSSISDIGISGSKATTTGIYLGNTAICNITNVNIAQVSTGISSMLAYMITFTQVRVLIANGYAFDFSTADEKTSFTFTNCYAEACGGGWTLQALNYSTFNSMGCDYCNWGSNPADPYGGAGGNYQVLSFVYYLASCSGLTFNSCGAESSNASWLYAESTQAVFNAPKLVNMENYVTPTGSNIAALIQLRGTSISNIRIHAPTFSTLTNQVAVNNLIRGIYIETTGKQKLIMDNYVAINSGFDNGGAGVKYTKNGIYYSIQRKLVPDSKFFNNIGVTELPFVLYNAGAYTAGALAYITNATTKVKNVNISTSGTDAPADASVVNHYWRWLLNPSEVVGKVIRLRVSGAQTTGGATGAPSFTFAHADDINGTNQVVLQAVTLADINAAIADYYVIIPATLKAVVYFSVLIPYRIVNFRLDELLVDIIDVAQ